MALKPCPFCGAEEDDILLIESHLHFVNPFIGYYCRECGGAMIKNGLKTSFNDLDEAWNRRWKE